MEEKGFIILYRKLIDWEWYDHIPTKVLFIHLLLKANHTTKLWRGNEIKRGQYLTSLNTLSQETGLSVKQIRASLNNLEKTGEVGKQTTNLNTLISITKYDDYQSKGTPKGKPKANEGQSEGKQRATTNNVNNDNNEEEEESDEGKPSTSKTLTERQIDFGIELKTYVEKYGNTMCKDFFDYWTESNANGKKMRFEMEKVFDVKRRLATWKSRQKTFNKDTEVDPLVINVNKAVGL
jgi:hypothetical protein